MNKKKVVLTTFGVGAAGVIGYFGWQHIQKMKANKDDGLPFTFPPIGANINTIVNAAVPRDGFPLKKGSKGSKVKQFQEALIGKYGKSILPKYGADGDFGSETVAALKTAGLPEKIDETTYNLIVNTSSINLQTVASDLFSAASKKDFNSVMNSLKQLKSTDDYATVSEHFSKFRLGTVRQTLVNGLLNAFSTESQKQSIRFEFSRMGLKYDGSKWSLSGINTVQLITISPATIWKDKTTAIKVPSNMVLGSEIASRNGFTVFENNNQKFIIQTQLIKRI